MEAQSSRPLARRFVLLGTPLMLGFLELWHPMGNPELTVFRNIAPIVDRWLILHLLQVPLFGLLALAVYLLVDGLHGSAAKISRAAMGVFIVFYTVLDAIAGVAIGILVRNASGFPAERQAVIEQAVGMLWWNPIAGNLSVMSGIGILGWVVGILSAAVALHRAGAPRLSIVLLVLAALGFGYTHARPFGPLGLLLFFAAALQLELRPWKPVHGDGDVASATKHI